MKKIHLDSLSENIDQEITFSGWITNSRSSGKIVFLQLRDGYGFVQAIVDQLARLIGV